MFKNQPQPSDSPSDDPPPPAIKKPRARWQVPLTVLVIGLIVGTIFGGRAAYRAAMAFWGRHLAVEAGKHMEDEKWESAARIIGDAVRNAPEDPDVLRVTAEFLRKTNGDPDMARHFLQKLHDTDEATPEDQIRLSETLITTGDTQRARKMYEQLATKDKQSRKGMELLAKILDDEGQKPLAMSTLRQSLLTEPNNPECVLRLAMLDLDQPFNESRRRAQETIWKIARGKDETALQAIGFLATSRELTAGEADELLKTVNAHPKTADKYRFPVLSAYMRLFPTRRKDVLDQECENYKGKGLDDMVHLLRWLAHEKQSDRILGLVPKSLVVKSPDAFPSYADALMTAGKWADLKALIQASPAPSISQANAHAYLAACFAKLEPNLVAAKQQIDNAYRAAEKAGEHQVTLRAAQLAESLGLWELASTGYENIGATNARARLGMLTKVYEMAALAKDGAKMLEVALRISKERPESWMFKARANYLRLVIGSGLESASDTILAMNAEANAATRDPDAASYIAVLRALAAYRVGDLARIKPELDGVTVTDTLPPGVRAVAAGLMKISNGDTATAFKLAEAVPASILLDEELRFLKMAL